MHELATRLLKTIRKQKLLRPGERVAVAVSGGADSVALLFLLEELRSELGIVLSVAHVNHKLRSEESDDDEHFVARLAARLGLELDAVSAPIAGKAIRQSDARATSGIEAAARKLRYGFFRELAERGCATKIATAHTLDDQAETVLLRIFRGTGIRGLAAIHPTLQLGRAKNGGMGALARAGTKSAGTFSVEVVRPLLGFRRHDLRDYLRARNEPWREDSSNDDPAFLRNRIRHRLLPLITQEFGGLALQHMAELAEIARAEEEYWSAGESKGGTKASAPPAAGIEVSDLLSHPLAVRRRQVRAWLEASAPESSISFALIEEILELAIEPVGKELELPGKGNPRNVRRGRSELALECRVNANLIDYEYALPVPGVIAIPELAARIEVQVVNIASVPEPERSALLNPDCTGNVLTIRNWRAGDRYWPAHTATGKKVKELLTDRHAAGAKKKLWPVAINKDDNLVWLRGFAAPACFQPRTAKAIWIREFSPNP
jgi:tRNA(Ile)-lysidine synthase